MRPRIGFLVPPPNWSARVVGVYARAISLLHDDGALVSLVRGPEDLEARAIALGAGWEAFSRRARESYALAEGGGPAFVVYGETAAENGTESAPSRALSLRGARGESMRSAAYTLALADAETWDPREELRRSLSAPRVSVAGLNAALRAARALLGAALARRRAAADSHEGLGGEGLFGRAFARLRERSDFPACLVGFGPGTTPAGDDWLAGFLAAAELRLLAAGLGEPSAGSGGATSAVPGPTSPRFRPRAPGGAAEGEPLSALDRLREDIRQRLPHTGAAGRALLLGALAGAPPAYLQHVRRGCLSCGADGGAELSLAIAAALGHGASSGWDSLEGFQAGLEGGRDFSPQG